MWVTIFPLVGVIPSLAPARGVCKTLLFGIYNPNFPFGWCYHQPKITNKR
jgi:hypothetical protein